jgi:hypothetical protein
MSKHKAPAPALADVVAYLSDDLGSSLALRLVVYPLANPHACLASAEVFYTHQDGTTTIVRREGEQVSTRSADQLHGAWFRAAVRLASYLDGKDADEVIRLHLWNGGWRR